MRKQKTKPPTPVDPPPPSVPCSASSDRAPFTRLEDLTESDFSDGGESSGQEEKRGAPKPPPPPRRAVVGTPAALAAQVAAWLDGTPLPGAPALACGVCPGVLLAGPAAAKNHVASKKHAARATAAGAASPSAPLKFAAAPDEVETHAERAARVAADAAARTARREAAESKDGGGAKKKRGAAARRPGKRPGKRQRAALKAAGGGKKEA